MGRLRTKTFKLDFTDFESYFSYKMSTHSKKFVNKYSFISPGEFHMSIMDRTYHTAESNRAVYRIKRHTLYRIVHRLCSGNYFSNENSWNLCNKYESLGCAQCSFGCSLN